MKGSNFTQELKNKMIKRVMQITGLSQESAKAELIAEEWDEENAIMYSDLQA